jgi:eukaryotic-like serine/threonine-protein kinase
MIGQTLGHYRILEKVGAGGMGVVYRARDEQLERDVAVKVLPSGTLTDDSVRRHFRREALALARLNHPNIETVYEFGSQDGVDFLVMEYVPGSTLARRIASGPLPEREVIALGIQIAAALEEAHERGIIHRDLKPANIALTDRGQAKVLDFGLAKLLRPDEEVTTDHLTESRAAAGTLPYMSPEQLRGEAIDARADVYTTGAVLYEMAAGRKAFAGELPAQVIDAILHQSPVPPRALNPRISAELEGIILKCLDKAPERRYQSAKELLVDLRRLGSPSARAATVPRGFRRKSFVLRAAMGAAAMLAIGLTLAAFNVSGLRDRLTSRAPSSPIRSLAVLPLENRSHDPEQDYFAEGITDELITQCSKISALKVISRTSVMRFKNNAATLPEIARSLHVDAVVEGSVQHVGDRVRINARLVQIHNEQEQPLWARSYERDLSDVLTLQSVLARAIADEVQVKLTTKEQANLSKARPVDPEAHEAYLAGRFYWNKGTAQGLEKSISYLDRAIARDPGYALAYAALADAYHELPELTAVPIGDAFPKARTAALKALEIDDSLGEAHSALASIKEDYDWDWRGAEKEYRLAVELSPGYVPAHAWYSNFLLELGRFPEALAEARIAHQLDPLSVFANENLCGILYYAEQYDQAVEQCQKTLAIDPLNHQTHRHLAKVYAQRRQFPEASAELRKAIELSQGNPEARAELGYVLGRWGKTKEARQILQDLQSPSQGYISSYRLAIVYIGLSEKERALRSLRQAVNERAPGVVHLKISPLFNELRSDHRFQELLVDIGLVDRNLAS